MRGLAQQHCEAITASTKKLNQQEIAHNQAKLAGWKLYESQGETCLEKIFKFEYFKQAMAYTNQLAQLANEENHHPTILTEWGKVIVTWWTHKIGGLHLNGFIMATKTDQLFDIQFTSSK
jgi:4a-hydroxytetrahydrobiopterin dehydratase